MYIGPHPGCTFCEMINFMVRGAHDTGRQIETYFVEPHPLSNPPKTHLIRSRPYPWVLVPTLAFL